MGFRKDFIWGAATASYQIEGAYNEDGKGLSVWDAFSHTPGKVYEGHTGDVACDHYHHVEEDVQLMADMGVKNYRFSIAWPRLLPEGTGKVNQKGIDFYNRLLDALGEKGIRPFVTLFHWDYPLALQHRGAWTNPDSVKWFTDYAALCAEKFGDRVKDFITFNEPACFIGLGYGNGEHAPGLVHAMCDYVPMCHHVNVAHGKTVQLLRELVPGARVGFAPNSNPCIPETESQADIDAARKAYFSCGDTLMGMNWSVAWWSDPAMLGEYPADALNAAGHFLPKGWEKDMATIHQPLDFYGHNIYSGRIIRAADNERGWEAPLLAPGYPHTAMDWPVTPDALYWGAKFLTERYKTPFIITENGMAGLDWVSVDGQVHDPARQDFLHRYLRAYRRAADDGVDVAGYFQWSLMDNFEWAFGYNRRFGLVHVDYQTQKRTVKDSGWWYKQVMETNGENL